MGPRVGDWGQAVGRRAQGLYLGSARPRRRPPGPEDKLELHSYQDHLQYIRRRSDMLQRRSIAQATQSADGPVAMDVHATDGGLGPGGPGPARAVARPAAPIIVAERDHSMINECAVSALNIFVFPLKFYEISEQIS